MGVDWYTCPTCGEAFPDCGPMVWCECGKVWCSDECAAEQGFKRDDDEEDEPTCNFCRKEDAEDDKLLAYGLELLGITRAQLVSLYFDKGAFSGQS